MEKTIKRKGNKLYVKKCMGQKKPKNKHIQNSIDFCIEFIDFMFAGKTLVHSNSLFSPYDFEKHDNIILSYFKNGLTHFKFE